ncbi:MAG: hypothetical protein A2W29_01835 [Gemmatimonadetes bacterium RBG_16_66_8]|nr:MAG: hypothetical protein A2W29_01835 [Gemmatimonadetes bacterium RBG_16_66_8]
MGVRAGSVVLGVAGVRAALQRGEVVLVVVADDHSGRTADKVVRLARAKGIPVAWAPGATALGDRLGRGAIHALGVKDRHLAAGMLHGS